LGALSQFPEFLEFPHIHGELKELEELKGLNVCPMENDLTDDIRDDPSTYPPDEVLQKLEAGMPLDAEGNRRREELWREVRKT